MEMTIRPMTKPEMMYCYAQSQQISMQTGLIGYLRADMDSNGKGFFSSFNDFRADLKTPDFKTEFDAVINGLRFDDSFGGMLKDRSALAAYCRTYPESCITEDRREFGFRADTADYAYMLRLNPKKGEYNLYCYCYQKKWLDRHLHHAEKGIRFIDPHYKEQFRIADGDYVRITTPDGEKLDRQCRYIDEYHVEVGKNLYHICEFAERMVQNGNKVIPLRKSLPDICLLVQPSGKVSAITKGEMGYVPLEFTPKKEANQNIVGYMNAEKGISKAQEAAMVAGSMFGWQVPAADPKNYDENGQPIKPKHRDRGDAR